MKIKWTNLFLIFAAAATLNLSYLKIALVLAGYLICTWFDQYQRTQALDAFIDYETADWKTSPDDPDVEIKGNLTRAKLRDREQILFSRIEHLLWQLAKRT